MMVSKFGIYAVYVTGGTLYQVQNTLTGAIVAVYRVR